MVSPNLNGVLGSPPQHAPVAALDAVFLQQKDGRILSNYGVDHRDVNQALQVSECISITV